MGVQSALSVAGFQPDAAYTAARNKLSVAVLSRAPYVPPSGGDDTAVQQAVRHRSRKYSVPWQGGGDAGKLAFLAKAKALPHPSNDHHLSLPKDLLELIEWVVQKREGVAAALHKRTKLLVDVECSLRPLNGLMLATCKPHVYHVVQKYNLAFMACMIDATAFPDVGLVQPEVSLQSSRWKPCATPRPILHGISSCITVFSSVVTLPWPMRAVPTPTPTQPCGRCGQRRHKS